MSFPANGLPPCRLFTFLEVEEATQSFDQSLVIGRGGFGKVYKGTIRFGAEGRSTAAIKRLESTSNQGEVEFWSEVEMLTRLRHDHLISLMGYCNDGEEMILIYEYMPRGTLEDHLHKRQTYLPWVTRLRICIGAARGLNYLHTRTEKIIHRDVKSSNILLDFSWEAKISDLGLSKKVPTDQPSTSVNTNVKGTFGYVDPDYFQTNRLTRKSDVYAFGVVLFEVLCRKRAVGSTLDEEQRSLASWAQDSIKKDRLKEITDTSIIGEISSKCLKKFAHLADGCLHIDPEKRHTMAEVLDGLKSILALQEKVNNTSRSTDMKIFGISVPKLFFPSIRESSKNGCWKALELFFNTLGNENKVLHKFDSKTIRTATDYFSKANRILKHSDNMYKGRLPNDQDIAVVGPYNGSMNGQFKKEAWILAQLEHDNLFNLLGYCIEGMKVLLVYEFTPIESLDDLLCDCKSTTLDWNNRHKIILGVARVLVYLHKNAPIKIIHCNVESGNILLDKSLNPRLWDFRWATEINDTHYIADGHCYGTYCRCRRRVMAPEYITYNILSTKVDVFSFGRLVLEMISGRTAYSFSHEPIKNLAGYARRNWVRETTTDSRCDPASSPMTTSFYHIGRLCIQDDPDARPTMEEVVHMLLVDSSVLLRNLKVPASLIKDSDDSYDSDSDDLGGMCCIFSLCCCLIKQTCVCLAKIVNSLA